MKDLKNVFDRGELKILYNVFSMFKFGVDDENRKLKIISSPIFKELFDEVNIEYITTANKNLPDKFKEPLSRYVEDQSVHFQTLIANVEKCIKMYKGDPDSNWSEWEDSWKIDMIINLASPYSIKESTIKEILQNNR